MYIIIKLLKTSAKSGKQFKSIETTKTCYIQRNKDKDNSRLVGNSTSEKVVEQYIYCSDVKTPSTQDSQCKYLSERKVK